MFQRVEKSCAEIGGKPNGELKVWENLRWKTEMEENSKGCYRE